MNKPLNPTEWKSAAMQARIARRYASERRFRALGLFAVLLSASFLAFLLVTMMANGLRGFTQTELKLTVDFPSTDLMLDPSALKGFQADQALAGADFEGVTATAAESAFGTGGAADEVDLAAEAGVGFGTDGVGTDLAGEVDFDGGVDGHHAVIAGDDEGVVGVGDGVEFEEGIVVDEGEELFSAEGEAGDQLSGMEGFEAAVHDSAFD